LALTGHSGRGHYCGVELVVPVLFTSMNSLFLHLERCIAARCHAAGFSQLVHNYPFPVRYNYSRSTNSASSSTSNRRMRRMRRTATQQGGRGYSHYCAAYVAGPPLCFLFWSPPHTAHTYARPFCNRRDPIAYLLSLQRSKPACTTGGRDGG
jgi:hypothetical protein